MTALALTTTTHAFDVPLAKRVVCVSSERSGASGCWRWTRFVERVERAFKTCDKNRQAAAATYDANPARGALEVGRRSVAAYPCPACARPPRVPRC